jgi:hypothetical protein
MADFFDLDKVFTAPLKALADAEAEFNQSMLNQLIHYSNNKDGVYELEELNILYHRTVYENDLRVKKEMRLTIPKAAVVPMTALQLKKTTLDMTLEIRLVENSKNEGGNQENVAISCIKVQGRAAAEKVRQGDYLAKMRVRIETTSADPPEGLKRIVDVLYTNIGAEPANTGKLHE